MTVEIHELSSREFPLVAQWLSDPRINRWLTSEWRGRTVDSRDIAIVSRIKQNSLYAVTHEGRTVGMVALYGIDLIDRCAMIWYLLGDRECAGSGVTTQAVEGMCEVGMREMGLASIYAWVMAPNGASIRVLEKSGFVRTGMLSQSTCLDGELVDRLLYERVAGVLS